MQVIIYDGFCNLCSSTVRFICRRRSSAQFHFIPLQSEEGERLMKEVGIVMEENSSVVYLKDKQGYVRSDAILHISKDLGRGWQIFYYGLIIIPSFVRDPIYNLIARVRYRIWGKRKTCYLPDLNESSSSKKKDV